MVLSFMIRILKNLSLDYLKKLPRKVNYRSQDLGRLAVDYAEGFTVERYLAVNSLGI
jgi:DNA-directed RNA polymerase specialized sigma24 family protein